MDNILKRLEKELRSYAKRVKNVKYSRALLISVLITGMIMSFTVSAATTADDIEGVKKSIDTSISSIKTDFKTFKAENQKLLKASQMELIKLMEQGDHVVKSPWSSWQFGQNYFYGDYRGVYKGRGDKSEKYPFEGVYTRSEDPFDRYTSPLSAEGYAKLGEATGTASSHNKNVKGYGLASTRQEQEPISAFEVSASINPKNVDKKPLNIQAKVANIPVLPEPVRFNPINPNIVIPDDPALPVPPTFAIVLGADCNSACVSTGRARQNTKSNFLTSSDNLSQQNVNSILHYTWGGGSGAEKGYAFKMFWEALNSTTTPYYLENVTENEIFFNSYNFGTEFPSAVLNSDNPDKNHQYFFIGGSRFIEVDNVSSTTPVEFGIPNGKTLQLGGIFTLGLVSQQNAAHLINKGTITDSKEKDDSYIQNMTQDLLIHGPTVDYTIHRSDDGYVGYKVAIAQVYENGGTSPQLLKNENTIDFRGERSIGIYTYITTGKSNAKLENATGATINLSGKESYGMKYASNAAGEGNAAMINDGTINIRKNPDGGDKADNSAAMALMADSSILNAGGVNLDSGKAKNTGTINITDVANSLGTYVNIASDITNTGNIKINSTIPKAASGSQSVNIGMRSDTNSNAKSINSGTITMDGSYAIGMLASGSKLTNTGTITTGSALSNGVGIVAINGANIENSGAIKITGTGDTKNIGVFLNTNSTGTIGTPGTTPQSVEVSGDNSTGVLVTGGSNLTMAGGVKVSGNSVSGIVANGTAITLNDPAVVTVDNGGAVAGEINNKGSYGIVVKGAAGSFTGTDTDVTAKVTTDKSIGLYSEGNLTVNKANITTTDGAINFFANNGKIITNGGTAETGQKSLLFYTSGSGANIQVNGSMNATIKGGTTPSNRGTAFYYEHTGGTYGTFDTAAIQSYFNSTFGNAGASTLGNLTLTMENGSRLFVASNVLMNLSNTSSTNLMSGITGAPTITGTDYKTFMLYLSKLIVDQAVDLDDPANPYNHLEIANSSIENADTMTGSQPNQVAMAQENGFDPSSVGYKSEKVTLTNAATGTITLTGSQSTGMYAKRGQIRNYGTINVADDSTAIYLVDDNQGPATATMAGLVANDGTINIGKNSTGIFYKVEATGPNPNVPGGVSNGGIITSNADNVVGITFDSPNQSKVFRNTTSGVIDLKGDNSAAMYATGAGTYMAVNEGTIKLASSASTSSPNLGMYTDKDTIALSNTGEIIGGDKTVGLYGYEVNLNPGSKTEVGKEGTAIYSQGKNVNLNNGASLTVGTDEAVGVYYVGDGGTINNSLSALNIGDRSYGFVISNSGPAGNTLVSNTPSVDVKNDTVFVYSTDTKGNITNRTVLNSNGDRNYGLYGAGTITNEADINFGKGTGNVGIYSIKDGTATNAAGKSITVGKSDVVNGQYGIGMAAGYGTTDTGHIKNYGTINVNEKSSIGMYASGRGTGAYDVENHGDIKLNASNTTGIYLDNGAKGLNTGKITTGSNTGLSRVVGVYVTGGAMLDNYGDIEINAKNGIGAYLKGGVFKNHKPDGMKVTGSGSKEEYTFVVADTGKEMGEVRINTKNLKAPTIVRRGILTTPYSVVTDMSEPPRPVTHSSIGMYMDTSSVNHTYPIQNVGMLTDTADLIIGTEAALNTTSKNIIITDPNIINPYRNSMIANPQVAEWGIYSGSLTWMASATLDDNGYITGVGLAKVPYTVWAGKMATPVNSTDTYNFTDGLEQRYGVEGLGTREKMLFDKITGIGNNEEILLYQAFDEMMGHQYGNLQQRIYATGNALDREFSHLKKDWRNPSKQNNKIKVFGMRDEYKTDTAGIHDYTSNTYGVAYVHEDETVKLGNSSGWYAGTVHNRFRLKDIGRSKENQNMIKAGIFKTMSPAKDHDGNLQWTVSGDVFAGIGEMKRKFLVVDDIFNAYSDYSTYGAGLKNELGYNVRLSERTHLRPYGSLKMEYGRFSSIKEDTGEIRLEVEGNDYYSIKPEVGLEFKYIQPLAVRTNLSVGLTAAYETELGKVNDVDNRARVRFTEADWFGIRGEKEDRRGSGKFDLNIGVDNTRFGVTVNAGYDTRGENVRGGIGFRAIY